MAAPCQPRAVAAIMLALFTSQFLLPTVFTRLVLGVICLVLVVDILVADRRQLPSLAGALRED